MPPKNKIKIVDVVDKEVKNDDAYTITNNEVEESKLPVENEPLETTEDRSSRWKRCPLKRRRCELVRPKQQSIPDLCPLVPEPVQAECINRQSKGGTNHPLLAKPEGDLLANVPHTSFIRYFHRVICTRAQQALADGGSGSGRLKREQAQNLAGPPARQGPPNEGPQILRES